MRLTRKDISEIAFWWSMWIVVEVYYAYSLLREGIMKWNWLSFVVGVILTVAGFAIFQSEPSGEVFGEHIQGYVSVVNGLEDTLSVNGIKVIPGDLIGLGPMHLPLTVETHKKEGR